MAAPWVFHFHSEECRSASFWMWKVATEAALEVIGALNIARGKEFVIPVPSNRITAEERLRLKKDSQKSRVGFNMMVQSMGTNV